jgi:hypothetical protein
MPAPLFEYFLNIYEILMVNEKADGGCPSAETFSLPRSECRDHLFVWWTFGWGRKAHFQLILHTQPFLYFFALVR